VAVGVAGALREHLLREPLGLADVLGLLVAAVGEEEGVGELEAGERVGGVELDGAL
jgi:hypothetical protein